MTGIDFRETLRVNCEVMMAIEASEWVRLSDEELEELVDTEARKRLGMSGAEFKRLYIAGKLPDTFTVRDIAMLLKLAA